MPRAIKEFLFFSFVSFCISYAAVLFLAGNHFREIILGWGISVVFSTVGLVIKMASVGGDIRKFFFYTFLVNAVNIAAFLGVVYFLLQRVQLFAQPFVLSVFIAYFVMLVYDIRAIRRVAQPKVKIT